MNTNFESINIPDFDDTLKEEKESGLFKLKKAEICNCVGHDPPMHLHIPYGYGYRHVCPKCKHVTILKSTI